MHLTFFFELRSGLFALLAGAFLSGLLLLLRRGWLLGVDLAERGKDLGSLLNFLVLVGTVSRLRLEILLRLLDCGGGRVSYERLCLVLVWSSAGSGRG